MSGSQGKVRANRVRIAQREIESGVLYWEEGRISRFLVEGEENPELPYLLPGFVDAHVHIESSMLVPSEFARMALRHGTLGAVSDPHEIANVLGLEGVQFMLASAAQTPFRFCFGAPSCVPATPFECAGASLGVEEVTALLDHPQIGHLAEVMNVPGVLAGEVALHAKLAAAQARGMPVDGHAPGLRGESLRRYAAAGIGSDHECTTLEEAEEKIAVGMQILIREGSAARNFTALASLIDAYPEQVMLCSDDKHPDDLLRGHINRLVIRAIEQGLDRFNVLRCACLNPVRYYSLPLGQLEVGDPMDAILVEDLQGFALQQAWLDGVLLYDQGELQLAPEPPLLPVNRFAAAPVTPAALRVAAREGDLLRVIEAWNGELMTRERILAPILEQGWVVPDIANDVLPLCVLNRYQPAPPALAFVRNFRLRRGAIASSVAHDSHNIIAVGADLESLATAINAIIDAKGGIVVVDEGKVRMLPLPVAGLMTHVDGEITASRYANLDRRAKELGSTLRSPFMTLSFMALLVIPELKLSDQGLFDGRDFCFTEVVIAGD